MLARRQERLRHDRRGPLRHYRYGLRWFGDFRGAVADVARTFCIDLRYWYPSKAMRFQLVEPDQLKNRDGDTVTYERQRRMAYAAWTFGRTNSANQQAAVMLYVHSQMGDAAPGEVDPSALNPTVASLFDRVSSDSERLHGPYRVAIGGLPSRMTVGTKAEATIRVVAESGAALPNVRLTLSAQGARVPGSIETDEDGVARVELTAADAGEITLSAKTEPLASTLPVYYFPTTPVGARNGQRMLAPDSQRVTGESTSTVGKVRLAVSTVARPGTVLAGRAGTRRRHDLRRPAELSGTRPRGALRPLPRRRPGRLQRRAGVARDLQGVRSRHVHDGGRAAREDRLVRVPGGDPRRRRSRRPDNSLQRPVRARQGRGAAAGDHGHLFTADDARRQHLRPRARNGPRR